MASVKMSLLTYNILRGGQGREEKIAKVIQAVDPDVVIVQEAQGVASFHRIAQALEMTAHLAERRRRSPLRVGLLSRLPVLSSRTLNLWPAWPSCLEALFSLRTGTL